MRQLLLYTTLLLGFAAIGQAQTPDCVIAFTFNAAGQRSAITGCGKNTQGVVDWRMTYVSNGFSAISLEIESAPDSAGAAGTWVSFNGTVEEGINPNTSTTLASTRVFGFNPWVSVTLASKTGTGTITGVIYGCREPGCGGVGLSGSSGSGCDAMTPCTVIGPNAVGAVPTEDPVQMSAFDGTNVRRVLSDTSGRGRAVGAAADGAAVAGDPVRIAGKDGSGNTQDLLTDAGGRPAPALATLAGGDGASNSQPTNTTEGGVQLYTRVLPSLFNGSTNDRQFTCNLSVAITLAAGTDVVAIPSGGGSTVTRICSIVFSFDTSADVTILQGTGSTCGTNQVSLSGALKNLLGLDFEWGPESALRNTVAARDTCLHFSTAVTGGGFALYAQY